MRRIGIFLIMATAVVICGCGKSSTIICPWAAGGGTDRNSRFWASALEQKLGNRCVVVNKTGGSGSTGHSAGANAKPDGRTITMITAELSTMHAMGVSELTFRDYRCLIQMNADAAAIIVHANADWQTLDEFLAYIKDHPGEIKMSGTATGGTWDLARAGLMHKAGLPIDSVKWIPTNGAKPSLHKLIGKHIDAVCCSVPEAEDNINAKQVRVLAVMSEERLPEYPNIPTVKDSNIDWIAVGWRGLAVPKDTPDNVVDNLTEVCMKIAQSSKFNDFMKKNKFGVKIRGAAEFTEFLKDQEDLWQPVVEFAGYQKK